MDVSDITSKEIHNLRARWNRKMRDDQVGWDSFDDFLRWSVENGYKQGREIRKKDYGKPHSKSNTFFTISIAGTASARDANKSVKPAGNARCGVTGS